MKMKRAAAVTVTSRQNETLHWAYLEFAIRSSRARLSQRKPPSIPTSRNVIEAIRYSYDFLDAAAEFAYAIVKDGPDGDSRPDSWLTRYVDRRWNSLSLSERLGFLSFTKCGEGFWRNDGQRRLFEELRALRNALTHPGIFGVQRVEEFPDLSDGPAVSSREVIYGKMRPRKDAIAKFAGTLAVLGREDGRKAVEIALRHAERFEQLFGRPGACLFGRINPRSNVEQSPTTVLARMNRRFFDSPWRTG
jgi:hypothetical protein